MNRIEEFNHRLNQSLEQGNNRHEDFKDQVDIVLRSILRRLSTKNQVCVIGAGKCNEFSLPIFMDAFHRIILSDIDKISVEECVKNRRTIDIQKVEYTGFESIAFFDDFKSRIASTNEYQKIDQIIKHKLAGIEDYVFLQDEFEQNDLVYVSPIYTQLIYQQIMFELSELRHSGYPEHLLKYLEEQFLTIMIDVINRFNENLILLVKESGYLLVLSDIFELDNGSDFYLRVKNSIKNNDVMDELHKGYLEKYGYGLGDYGLYNLDEKLPIVKSRWMFWSFSQKKSFAVKMNIYQKNFKGGTL